MEVPLKFMLILASSGMILSWINAWSGFLMSCISGPSFEFMEMFLLLVLSVFVTYLHRGKGWRIINIMIIHLLYLLFAMSWTTYMLSNLSVPYWDVTWITSLMELDRGIAEWTALIFSGIIVFALWIFGIRLAGYMDEDTISNRFDTGIAMLSLLLLIKLLIKIKEGTIAQTHNTEIDILYFFLFGLFAVGLSRYQGSNKNNIIDYYKSSGIIISFTIAIFILGGLFSTLLLPGLTAGAEISYNLIKTVSRPILQVFVLIIRILFVTGCRKPIRAEEPTGGMNDEIPFDPTVIDNEGLSMIIFRWSLLGIGAVILVFFIILILYYIYKILSFRTKKIETRDNIFDFIFYLISAIKSFVSQLLHKILHQETKVAAPSFFYNLLLRWGTRSGLPLRLSETPYEYGLRLARFFPSLRKEFADIIEMHDRSLYGEISFEAEQLRLAEIAWRSLKSPRIWPMRIRTWLNNPSQPYIPETNK